LKTADEFRADLMKVIPNDPELVEATTLRYFSGLRKRKKRKPYRTNAKPGPHDSKTKHEAAMQNASELMARACRREQRGENAAMPDELLWTYERNNFISKKLAEQGEAVRAIQENRAKIEALKISSSEPCYKCGAARSCEHREVTRG